MIFSELIYLRHKFNFSWSHSYLLCLRVKKFKIKNWQKHFLFSRLIKTRDVYVLATQRDMWKSYSMKFRESKPFQTPSPATKTSEFCIRMSTFVTLHQLSEGCDYLNGHHHHYHHDTWKFWCIWISFNTARSRGCPVGVIPYLNCCSMVKVRVQLIFCSCIIIIITITTIIIIITCCSWMYSYCAWASDIPAALKLKPK